MPHLLTDEQKRQRVKVAIKLLQMFPKYDKKQLANFVTCDETWAGQKRKQQDLGHETQQTPNNCQTFFECKEGFVFLYAIFFSGEGVAIKVPVKKHHRKVLQRGSTEET